MTEDARLLVSFYLLRSRNALPLGRTLDSALEGVGGGGWKRSWGDPQMNCPLAMPCIVCMCVCVSRVSVFHVCFRALHPEMSTLIMWDLLRFKFVQNFPHNIQAAV